jgi:Cytochrome c7 and related cytochrome c
MNSRVRIIFVLLVATLFGAIFLNVSTAQRRKDSFSHASKSHVKINCASCHKNPTANWISARGYPDVADYPGHASCIGCHRADFFAGNRPAICAGCHTNPGPRGAARFPFPVRTRSQEFNTIFPHDVHQNLIASNSPKNDIAVAHFVNASFRPADDPKASAFNNCAVCHQTTATLPKFGPRKLPLLKPLADAVAETFAPTAVFFKNSPNSHASCFTCHYQNQKPARTDCAGCHSLTKPYIESNEIARYSLKFDHLSKNHANKDCTTCHVRITQNSDLKTMTNADVPIQTCSTSSCHGQAILEEIGKREAGIDAKQPAFQCSYCHTPEIGRFPIPQSHQIQ